MNRQINALLAFCEGPHDSAFVRIVLKQLMNFSVEKLKFSEMPSPFDKLFETAVKTHAAQDMSLDMAHKFFLPDTVLRNDNTIVYLFNCGGKTQYSKIKTLLASYLPLFQQAETFARDAEEITQSVRYLFLYDTDADGLQKITENLNQELKTIEGDRFINNDWLPSTSDFGKISNDKAVFVWGLTPEKGTLEDILIPIFEFDVNNQTLMDKTRITLNDMFEWDINNPQETRAVAENEKFQKALLTTIGQRKKPGSSMNVILEQSQMITQQALAASDRANDFIIFLNEFLDEQ